MSARRGAGAAGAARSPVDPPPAAMPRGPARENGARDRDEAFRLASRPAWSIRSRRGALPPFLMMLRKGRAKLRARLSRR